MIFFFFFNDPATTEIYTLSLHDALPISSTLRGLAIETGDPALNSESGFPVVVDRLRARLAAWRAQHAGSHAAAIRSSLAQVASTLAAEHSALTQPAER